MELPKTWVVECYMPDADDDAVRVAADRAAGEVARLDLPAERLQYLGALLMAVDEVVFHEFRADDLDLVRRVSVAADLRFARIVESVEVLPQAPLHGSTDRPIRSDFPDPLLLLPDGGPR